MNLFGWLRFLFIEWQQMITKTSVPGEVTQQVPFKTAVLTHNWQVSQPDSNVWQCKGGFLIMRWCKMDSQGRRNVKGLWDIRSWLWERWLYGQIWLKKKQPELFDGLERKNTTILPRDLSPARNSPSKKTHQQYWCLVISSVFELMEILTS